MRYDALRAVLSKQNEAILSELQLDGALVTQDQLSHQAQHRRHRLGRLVVGGGVFGCCFVPFRLVIVVSIQVFSGAQQQWS